MPQVRKSELAKSDLDNIWLHIAEDNPVATSALLDRIDEQCAFLARHPAAGRARLEVSSNIRSFPVGHYMLFYQPIRGGIRLLRVLHGARDLPLVPID